jgi:hypothetical protein
LGISEIPDVENSTSNVNPKEKLDPSLVHDMAKINK